MKAGLDFVWKTPFAVVQTVSIYPPQRIYAYSFPQVLHNIHHPTSRTVFCDCEQVRQKRGTWRLPTDDTPVESKRAARKERSSVSSASTPSAQDDRDACSGPDSTSIPPCQRMKPTSKRRPPPIEIPPPLSRLPAFEHHSSAEKGSAIVSGAQFIEAVEDSESAPGAQQSKNFHGAALETASGADSYRQPCGSFASKRPSHRSFASARSHHSNNESDRLFGGVLHVREGVPSEEKEDEPSDADDLEFFDAIEIDEAGYYAGVDGM